ncbi:MAG: hypothetical protein HYZ37_17385 [Candidatus Solibacter usitatus]|nr:hypothetical protein [Candidatus Solibacter usitatus]
MWWIYELPVGKGRKFLSGSRGVVDHVLGGWTVSGVWSQSTELPVSVGNGLFWATNWNVTTAGTPVGPISQSTKTKNVTGGTGGPNIWPNPKQTINEWLYTPPGQSGTRNTLRVDGLSGFDIGFSKRFRMPFREKHTLMFRWETFNLLNQVRFTAPDIDRSSVSTFGNYTGQANDPRQMQFALRYEF